MRFQLGFVAQASSGGVWTPADLFAASEEGAWYDLSDFSTLFQDRAGTTPVTAAGQTVGHMLDKSGNDNDATAPSDAARPLADTIDGQSVIESDFVDDALVATNTLTTGDMVIATPYGWQYTPDMQFDGVNVRVPLNWPTDVIVHEGLTEAQLTAIANAYGTQKFMISVTNDSTLANLRAWLNDASTSDLLIVGANGDTTTITLGANSNSSLDLGTTTLTSPHALVWSEDLIGNTALLRFYCYDNKLTGSIPSLSSNTALQYFYCHNNQLTGSIPDLSSNTALQYFYCYNNQLTGSIPDLSSNTALQHFYCNNNELTGSIPDLSSNTALEYFSCGRNQLTGSIPGLSSNTALEWFSCDRGQLTGSIPDLSSNTALQLFYCNNNELTGWAGGTVSSAISEFEAQNNLLSESAVNGLLIAFDNAGSTSGTLNLGGTGNAAATGAGLTAKASLQAKSWTVETN